MKNVTFIIKTFERKYCIKRLVKSIYKKYPNAKVLIADDSEVSCKEYLKKKYPFMDLHVYELEKDSGLATGRNYLLKKVKTKYFVLLDDDFVFDKSTNVEKGIKILEEKNLDILGGFLRNYAEVNGIFGHIKVMIQMIIKWNCPRNYIGELNYEYNTKTLYANYITNEFPEYTDSDITLNLFIANTKRILENCMWDDELKLQEHTAFFLSAKNAGLKIGFSNVLSVQHKPIKLKKYGTFRNRNYIKIFMKKNNIERIITTYNHGNEVVTYYDK